jgi:hypothetical protein
MMSMNRTAKGKSGIVYRPLTLLIGEFSSFFQSIYGSLSDRRELGDTHEALAFSDKFPVHRKSSMSDYSMRQNFRSDLQV